MNAMSKINNYISQTRLLKDYNFDQRRIDQLRNICSALGFDVMIIPVYSSNVDPEIVITNEKKYLIWDEHIIDHLKQLIRNLHAIAIFDFDNNSILVEHFKNRIIRNKLNLLSWDIEESLKHSFQMAVEYYALYEKDKDLNSDHYEVSDSVSERQYDVFSEIVACYSDIAVLFILIHELMHIKYNELDIEGKTEWIKFIKSLSNVRSEKMTYSIPGSQRFEISDNEYDTIINTIIEDELTIEELFCDYNSMRISIDILTANYIHAGIFETEQICWHVIFNGLLSVHDFLQSRKVITHKYKTVINESSLKEHFSIEKGAEIVNRHILCGELINRDYYALFHDENPEKFYSVVMRNIEFHEAISHIESLREKYFSTPVSSFCDDENIERFIKNSKNNFERFKRENISINDIEDLKNELLNW